MAARGERQLQSASSTARRLWQFQNGYCQKIQRGLKLRIDRQ